MAQRFLSVLGAVLLLWWGSNLVIAFAEDLPHDHVKLTAEQMYQQWSLVTPADILHHAQEAAKHIHRNREQAFKEFNDASNPQWWPNPPFFSPVIVMRCDELRDVTHVYPEFLKSFSQPGVIRKFADTRGKHTFFDMCVKLKQRPDRPVWLSQLHFWPGVEGPVWMAVLGDPVKGTPYVIQGFYITANPDIKKLNREYIGR